MTLTVDIPKLAADIDGEDVWLTPMEWKLLIPLARARGGVVPHTELEHCGTYTYNWHIKNMRKKGIEIKARRGMGFHLTQELKVLDKPRNIQIEPTCPGHLLCGGKRMFCA